MTGLYDGATQFPTAPQQITVTQTGRRTWEATVERHWSVRKVYALTERGAEQKGRRVLRRWIADDERRRTTTRVVKL